MSFPKTPAELSETRAPTSSAQPPTTGQRHHHHHHRSQHHMTPAQARPASSASVKPNLHLEAILAQIISSRSMQPAHRNEAPRSKPAAVLTTYHAPMPLHIDRAPRQPMTGGVGASCDPRLRKANVQTATPPIPASPTLSSVSLGPSRSNERENTVTDTPIFPTPSLEVMETMAGPQRRKRSSNEATGEAKRYCGSRFPPLDNLSWMMSPNIRAAMTDPAPNESRTKESKEGKYVGSSKTLAKSSKSRAPTSSAQPPTTGQSHSQHQMTPAQARPASYASVAARSGSPQPVIPPSVAEHLAVEPALKNSDPSMQQACRSESPRSKPVGAFPTYRTNVVPAPRQPITGRSANAQTTTPPRDVRVNTVTDTPMFPTPSLENMETMARPQRRKRSSDEATGEAKRYCGSRSPPLDNQNTMMSPNIRAAMTDPAPNESRTKESKEGKYVGSSKTLAKSSKSRAPTSSAQPPTTGQSHSQHQMTPAQARPASYASVAARSGSPQPVVPPSVAEHLAVPPARKNSDPTMQQARRSESPRSKPVGAFPTYRTNVVPAPRQPITGRSANAQTTTPPRDVRVNTVTDTPMFPTPSLENMETMARPQRRKRSSDEATGEAKRYCGSRSPPLDNQNTMMSPNIRAAMTDPAPNESRTKESKEGKYVGSSKTLAKSSKSQAPTSSAQPPTTGQSHSQHQMTPAQARPASYASVAARSGSPQPVVPPSVAEHLAVPPARKNSDPTMQQARRSESPRSKPVGAFPTYRTNVVPAPRQPITGRSANAQTTTPPRDVRVNTVTDTPMFPTPSLENMETMARPQRRKRSSDEATGEAKRYCGSRSPPLDNQNTMMSPNIRAAMTGPAQNESRTMEPEEGQCVGSSKTPAESSKPRVSTSSAQPPTTGQSHPQHQMTPAQARPASYASIAAPSGSPQPVIPPSVAEHLAVEPALKNSDPSMQQACRSESPRSEPVAAFPTYRTYEIPAPCQPMMGGVFASRDPILRSANEQTMTPPVPASSAPPRTAAYDSSASLTGCSCAGSNVSPGPSRSDVSVNTATDTPMFPTPSLENVETMARPQLRKWYCGSSSPLLGNLSRSISLSNIRAAMTGPAQNESRTMEPEEGQYVGSSKTPAESSKPQAPTRSAQPPTTGQPHPQHQMTPAQARPASYASFAAASGSPQPVIPPSVAEHLAVEPALKNSDPSMQQACRSESPHSERVAAFPTYRTYEITAPRQPMMGGVGSSRDPRLRSANEQTMTPPVPASSAPPRAAAYDSSASLTGCSCAGSNVSPGPSRSDVSVNTATDTPMFPTPSLENVETMARPQLRKWYCGSSSPLLGNLSRSISLSNIRAAMTGPAQNESRTMEPEEGQYVGSSKTPAESSKPQAPTRSAQPPTTGQPHPEHQMTPAQARPASYASFAAASGSSQPVIPPSVAEHLAVEPALKNSDPSMQQACRSESPRSKPVGAFPTYRTYEITAPRQPMMGGVGSSRDPRLRSANEQTMTPPVPASSAPPRAAAYDSSASLTGCSCAGSNVSPGSSRSDVSVNTATDTPMFPTPSLENVETMARPQLRKWYCGSSCPLLGNLSVSISLSNIRAVMTGPAQNESRTMEPEEGQCVGSSKTPGESSKPQAPTSSAQPPTTGQPQHQMTPAQAQPASSASVVAPSDSRSPPLDNLNTMNNAGVSCVAPGPQDSELARKWLDLAEAIRSLANADACRAASGINQSRQLSPNSESNPSEPKKMADADASRAAESNPSEPSKDENKPLKTKKKPNKRWEALNKKITKRRADIKIFTKEKKELYMLEMKDKAKKRLEKRKLLMERDEEIIKRVDENLMRPTDQ